MVALTVGLGLTITVTVVVLVQLPVVAVMLNIVVCCVVALFVTVPVIEFPVPLAAIPVIFVVLLLVQLNVVPGTLFGLLISIWVIVAPEQIDCVEGVAPTVGLGLTVIVAVVVLEHPAAVDAVMVKIVVCGVLVVFVNVPEIVDPVPLPAMPVRFVVLSLVQLNVVPATLFGLDITIFEMGVAEQTV